LQLTWNDDGELGNLELVDIDDIQLEFSDWNSAPKCCHTSRHPNCQACSAPYSSSKIIFKFLYTLEVLINIDYIENIQIMGFMRIQLHGNDQHTPFIKFARCCTNIEPQKPWITWVKTFIFMFRVPRYRILSVWLNPIKLWGLGITIVAQIQLDLWLQFRKISA
jgi:hypothetical protein